MDERGRCGERSAAGNGALETSNSASRNVEAAAATDQTEALRQAYLRLGFSRLAADSLIDDHNLGSIDSLRLLRDGDALKVCERIRHPIGTIQVGDERVPKPGIDVSVIAAIDLDRTVYWIKLMNRISRPATPQRITIAAVRELHLVRAIEKDRQPPTWKPVINHDNWFHTLEDMEYYFSRCLGCTNIPLSYVLREQVDVPVHADDPRDNYPTLHRELIARAPHGTPAYRVDREIVFHKILEICRGDPCTTLIYARGRNRDGRAVFQALRDYYLSPGAVCALVSKAEAKLSSITWDGKDSSPCSFSNYILSHLEQHTLLEGLDNGIDERSKVRYLVQGIREPDRERLWCGICASPDTKLRNSFVEASLYCQSLMSFALIPPRDPSVHEPWEARRDRSGGGNERKGGKKDRGRLVRRAGATVSKNVSRR